MKRIIKIGPRGHELAGKVEGVFPGRILLDLPAELEYYPDEQNVAVKTGWNGFDQRFHVQQFFKNVSEQDWIRFLASLEV